MLDRTLHFENYLGDVFGKFMIIPQQELFGFVSEALSLSKMRLYLEHSGGGVQMASNKVENKGLNPYYIAYNTSMIIMTTTIGVIFIF